MQIVAHLLALAKYIAALFGLTLSLLAVPSDLLASQHLAKQTINSSTAKQNLKHSILETQLPQPIRLSTQTYPNQENYPSKRISLHFQDIKVRSVLQLFAQFTGLNLVSSDTVQGSITIQLNNVPWEQALTIILKMRGLAKQQIGNIILIAPTEEFVNRKRQTLEIQQDLLALEPLHAELIQINYAKAQDIANLLKDRGISLLSPRGNISADTRTNTLWVQDVTSKLREVKRLISRLDIPVKQVMIEAHIVNIDKNFARSLGIKFGINQPNPITNVLESLNRGLAAGQIPLASRLNIDLRAPKVDNAQSATASLALAKLGKNILLDLELSALESEGAAEIISTPKLITANQMTAKIESGEEIPFQETTSGGATSTSFKKAVLSLNVMPQITPDGRIILNLKVNQDKRGAQAGQNQPPAIDTRNIETQVLVDNGQTIVLGGVYKQEKNNQVYRVPLLSAIPVLGELFKQKYVHDNRTELLIFVTPKIIQ